MPDLSVHVMGLVSVVVHMRTTVVPTRTVPVPLEEPFMLLVTTGGRGAGGFGVGRGGGGGGGHGNSPRRNGEEGERWARREGRRRKDGRWEAGGFGVGGG